ncbi:MAG TPA: uridine phosphorylase [Candidatus Cryosericum sp.]|nr:uridine phosphorylase [Candidatus Cryosericum sp.]
MAHALFDGEYKYHIKVRQGEVGRYVLLPGDPGRCELIARAFDNPVKVAQNREYVTYSGTLLGERVSVTSTGIGGPSTAIAVEELSMVGADTFIRVGTSGAMQPGMSVGDLAIVTAAIRDEGTSRQYLPVEFPAVADMGVTLALKTAAASLGYPLHLGITQSKDSFYGEISPDRQPVGEELKARRRAWIAGGAICSEMESSTLFVIASILRRRAGGVMLIVNNDEVLEEGQPHEPPLERLVLTGVEALKLLIRQDRASA